MCIDTDFIHVYSYTCNWEQLLAEHISIVYFAWWLTRQALTVEGGRVKVNVAIRGDSGELCWLYIKEKVVTWIGDAKMKSRPHLDHESSKKTLTLMSFRYFELLIKNLKLKLLRRELIGLGLKLLTKREIHFSACSTGSYFAVHPWSPPPPQYFGWSDLLSVWKWEICWAELTKHHLDKRIEVTVMFPDIWGELAVISQPRMY